MKLTHRLFRTCGFTLVEVLSANAILLPLATLFYQPVRERLTDYSRQVASNKLFRVHEMLKQFQLDHSVYPCDATAEELAEQAAQEGCGPLSGDTANPYFRQLLLKAGADAEKNFFLPINQGGKALTGGADNVIAGGKALERGENMMAYVLRKGQDGSRYAVNNPKAPVVICAVEPSPTPYPGSGIAADGEAFNGKGYMLTAGGDVYSVKLSDITVETQGKAVFKPELFPTTRRGRNTADDYVVLSPEL